MSRQKQAALSRKQQRFIEEYVANNGNGSAAVRAAGYSTSSSDVVRQQATENLAKPHIRSAIAGEIARLGKEITPDRVRRRLDEISHSSEDAGQFGPAVRAEELLGKSIGMWIDQSIHLEGQLKGEHIQALIEIARRRQLEPSELVDDASHNPSHSDDSKG
jgi:phage terminase small subunit